MCQSLVFLSKLLTSSSFANFWAKNEQFVQKTFEQIPNLAVDLFLLNVLDYINAYAFKMNKSLKCKYSEAQQLPAIMHSTVV